ncbi:hypothetical protein CSHISOI_10916, partial [Colletotrichum shisoi]
MPNASELGIDRMRVSNPDHSDFYCRCNAVTDTVEHGLEVCGRYKDDDSPRDEGEELGYCGIPEHVDGLREIEKARAGLDLAITELLEDPSLAEVNDVIHEGWIYLLPPRTSCRPGRPPDLHSVTQIDFVGFHVTQRVPEEVEGLLVVGSAVWVS